MNPAVQTTFKQWNEFWDRWSQHTRWMTRKQLDRRYYAQHTGYLYSQCLTLPPVGPNCNPGPWLHPVDEVRS